MLLAIGMVLFALGIIGLLYGVVMRMRAGRVTSAPLAPTGEVARQGRAVAGPKGQISAQGSVVCQQPLVAPFSGQPCLYFHIKCTAKWKAGDTHKTQVVDEQKMAAQFAIDDGTGPVWIDAREGGDFEPSVRKSETRGTGLIGGLTGTELVFGQYRVNTPILDIGTKYEVEEECFPMTPRVYALGAIGEQPGVIAAPGWRQLILSAMSRDELLASTTKTAKLGLIIGGALFVVGGALAAVGQFVVGGKDDDAKSKMEMSASATMSAPPPPPPPIVSAADTAPSTPPAASSVPAAPGGKKPKPKPKKK